MSDQLIIGLDESGTGAFAGPFTICAFMSWASDGNWIKSCGARDSKKLTHSKRLVVREALLPCAVVAKVEIIDGNYVDQREVWRRGIAAAVKHCLGAVDWRTKNVDIVIDGAADIELGRFFNQIWGIKPLFVPGGDAVVPQISAASIFAKVARTEEMMRLHQQFPMYGWASAHGKGNDGYGTRDHVAMIEAHGICCFHRRIRPLLPYFDGAQEVAVRHGVQDRD